MGDIKLIKQSYGIAMAQCTYGGPRGIWLECQNCDAADRLAGVPFSISGDRRTLPSLAY